jgi:putative membrane protein
LPPSLGPALALLNACLITGTTVLMIAGYRAIRQKNVRRHRRAMLTAFGLSAAFMVSFVVRYVCFGRVEFRGTGGMRALYFLVLFSHEPIAFISVPIVLATVALALTRRVDAHREVARIALPLWLYASVTGIAIYVLLYLR